MILRNRKFYDKLDEELVNKAIDANIRLISGRNNEDIFQSIKDKIINRIEDVFIHRKDDDTYLKGSIMGCCVTTDDGNVQIHLTSTKDLSKKNNLYFFRHVFTHEFFHCLQSVFMSEFASSNYFQYFDDSKSKSFAGCIEYSYLEDDSKSYFYGVFFMETITDLLTRIVLKLENNFFDNESFNNILFKNTDPLVYTSYSRLLPLVRVMIAASENRYNDYDDLVWSGIIYSFKSNNGEEYLNNDFLYGMIFDTKYFENIFDKYTGVFSYFIMCDILDEIFDLECEKNRKIDKLFRSNDKKKIAEIKKWYELLFSDKIKHYFLYVKVFYELKIADLIDKGVVSRDEASLMNERFYNILNNTADFYNIDDFNIDSKEICKVKRK